jgi:hypothetical protein
MLYSRRSQSLELFEPFICTLCLNHSSEPMKESEFLSASTLEPRMAESLPLCPLQFPAGRLGVNSASACDIPPLLALEETRKSRVLCERRSLQFRHKT